MIQMEPALAPEHEPTSTSLGTSTELSELLRHLEATCLQAIHGDGYDAYLAALSETIPKLSRYKLYGLATVISHGIQEVCDRNYQENRTKSGGVYVLEFDKAHVKIGMTTDFATRAKMLATQSATTANRWAFIPTQRYREVEKMMHSNFAEQRIKGEFFSATFEAAVEHLRALADGEYLQTGVVVGGKLHEA